MVSTKMDEKKKKKCLEGKLHEKELKKKHFNEHHKVQSPSSICLIEKKKLYAFSIMLFLFHEKLGPKHQCIIRLEIVYFYFWKPY